MYIAEIVPPRIRGGVVSFNQLMITLGHPRRVHRRLGLRRLLEQLALDVRRGRDPGRCPCNRDVLHAVLAALARREGPQGRRPAHARPLPRLRRGRRRRRSARSRRSAEEEFSLRRAPGQGRAPDDDRRRRARDLPADRRHQHGHLLRADHPQVRRPAEHRGADPERLHRLHQRLLHDRRDPAARQARPALLPDHRHLDPDRGTRRPRGLLRLVVELPAQLRLVRARVPARLHRGLRDRARAGLLADDRRDLPAPDARPRDGASARCSTGASTS